MQKIQQLLLVFCSVLVLLVAWFFFQQAAPIKVEAPILTQEMLDNNQRKEQKRQLSESARRQAEFERHLYQCTSSEDCIVVDKDPCGCLKGPEGVTAINSAYLMEFSRIMEKQFNNGTVSCPSEGSVERECSPHARPSCEKGRCRIIY